MPDIGPLFKSKWDNDDGCECGEDILEDDRVAFVDGELTCEDCVIKLKQADTAKFTKKLGKK